MIIGIIMKYWFCKLKITRRMVSGQKDHSITSYRKYHIMSLILILKTVYNKIKHTFIITTIVFLFHNNKYSVDSNQLVKILMRKCWCWNHNTEWSSDNLVLIAIRIYLKNDFQTLCFSNHFCRKTKHTFRVYITHSCISLT